MEQAADSDAINGEPLAGHPRRWLGFKLAPEQLSACRWFAEALDVAPQEEENQTPLRNRPQHACLLMGAGGRGKSTIILELMLDVFFVIFFRPDLEKKSDT